MGNYIDKAYVLKKISQKDYDNLTDSTDANLVVAIESAESMVDSYLRSKIKQLPLESPPESIKSTTYSITLWHLHDRIQPNKIPEWVLDKYDAAINYLKDIANGKATLTFTEGESPELESEIVVDGYPKRMRRDMW